MNAHLKEIISSGEFVLVDFHAIWCEPCKWVEPILNEVEKHFSGKVLLKKIDIDVYPDIARDLHVLSVPTILLFKNGEEVWRIRGFDTLTHMIEKISVHLNSAA
jgi:thioredoxin 1